MRKEAIHQHPYREARMHQDLQAIRKKNLRALIKDWDGPTNLAKKLGYAGPSYLSQLIGPGKPITEKTARHIEQKLTLPTGWMDRESPQPLPPGAFDSQRVDRLMLAIISTVDDAKLHLPPRCMANLVSFVYECATTPTTADDAFIRKLVALMKCAVNQK